MSHQSESDEKPEAEKGPEFGSSTRRTFLSRLGMASLLATAAPAMTSLGQRSEKMEQGLSAAAKDAIPVTLTVNGKEARPADRSAHHVCSIACARHLHLTGSKKGCDHGQCGACTVHVNGRRVNSCLCLRCHARGRRDHDHRRHRSAGESASDAGGFRGTCDAYQCGYCTSGQIMSAVALLKEPCGPEDAEVKEFMSGNICRCGAYPNIVAAIQSVRQSKTRKPG